MMVCDFFSSHFVEHLWRWSKEPRRRDTVAMDPADAGDGWSYGTIDAIDPTSRSYFGQLRSSKFGKLWKDDVLGCISYLP